MKPEPLFPHIEDLDTWQILVDAAHAALAVHDAKRYGLLKGGPDIYPEHCEEVLKRGKALGLTPSPNCVQKFIEAIQWDYELRKVKPS